MRESPLARLGTTVQADTAALVAPTPSEPSPLRRFNADDYAIGEELGRGGMGQVLLGDDRRLGRQVAVKRLLDAGPAREARFVREMLITARLQHPAIVPVYEAGRWSDGTLVYTMRKIEGRNLRDCLRDADLTERLGYLSALITAAEAVAYAHTVGVIHRDLKPGNLVVGDYGETVVIDWGLARIVGDSADEADRVDSEDPAEIDVTRAGAMLGTPGYMSPEQARGDTVDDRTDVYALGACLYQILTGSRPPVDPDSAIEIGDGVPPELSTICHHAMAAAASERPSAKELAAELRRYQTGALVQSHDYTSWDLLRRWIGRHRLATAIAALSAVMLAVLVARLLSEVKTTERALADVVAKSDRLALSSARGLVQTDPLEAIRTLSELGVNEAMWDPAHTIASQARHRGLPAAVVRTEGATDLDWVDGRLIASSPEAATVIAPSTGSIERRELPRQNRRLDASRWLGWRGNQLVVADALAGSERPVHAFQTRPEVATASLDGRLVAAVADRELVLWRDGNKQRLIPDVFVAELSRDGERLAVATGDVHSPVVSLIETREFTVIRKAGPLRSSIKTLRFAVGTDLRIQLTNGVNLLWREDGTVQAIVCDPETPAAYSRTMHACVRAGSMITGPESSVLAVAITARDVEISEDRPIVAVASDRASAYLWNHEAGLFRELAHPSRVTAVALPRTGDNAYTLAADGWIRRWELTEIETLILDGGSSDVMATRHLPPMLNLRAAARASPLLPAAVAVSATSERGLFARRIDGALHLVSRDLDGDAEGSVPLPGAHVIARLTADDSGRWAAAATAKSAADPPRTLHIVDLETREVTTVPLSGTVTALAFELGAPRLLVGTDAGHASRFAAPNWERDPVAGGKSAVVAIAGHRRAVALAHAGSGAITLIDPSGERRLERHRGNVAALAFNPDGTELVSTGGDRELVRWTVASGDATVLAQVIRAPAALRFSPSGRTLGAYGPDGGTLVDVATGEHRPVLALPLSDLRFSRGEGRVWAIDGAHAFPLRDDLPRGQAGLRAWINAQLGAAPPRD